MRCNYMVRYLEGIFGEGVVCPNRGNKVRLFWQSQWSRICSLCLQYMYEGDFKDYNIIRQRKAKPYIV